MPEPSRRLAAAAVAIATVLLGCPPDEQKCDAGQTLCFGRCVDTQTDANACGKGCLACSTGAACVAGVCECPTGLADCGGACVDTQTSAAHCGGCGRPCGLGTCSGGACGCDPGATPCPDLLWPRCVNTASDASNCGSCRNVCPLAGDLCSGGTCQCPATLPDACSTACVDLGTDERNCGTCDHPCATGATCGAGTCTCPAGSNVCGVSPGVCVDQGTDEGNCGSCGNVCASGASCAGGSCTCPAAAPVTCGTTAKRCCAGTGCCGTSCMTGHSNGLGQSFYDCLPLSTFTLQSAMAAADAWSAGTSVDMGGICGAGCYGRQTTTSCATWCYSGGYTGQVVRNDGGNACTCPPGPGFLSTWN